MNANQQPGTVVGVLMNDPASLSALGAAVHAPPYQAPPLAPVLYIKPRNTHRPQAPGAAPISTALPDGTGTLAVGATLGLVLARDAKHVAAADAMAFVAGVVPVVDLFVPHTDVYRPCVRLRAFDASCLLGDTPVPMSQVQIESTHLTVSVDGQAMASWTLSGMVRSASALLADVSAFMTLSAGDVLLLGLKHALPRVAAHQRYRVVAAGLPALEGRVTPT
jgi:5-oxopent-3-ene-1,2,5-tricarboxylate decarboxylase / 2-hydroxyhepta-2,4-diene-1,7-dioate isomerase